MLDDVLPSDVPLLDTLRQVPRQTIAELSEVMEVTATAVRQRLNRLMGQGYVQRETLRSARGRPSHTYALTAKGRRQSGSNFSDLATALWAEVRAIENPEVRRGLLERVARRLAEMYRSRTSDGTASERMAAVAALFSERRMPMAVTVRPEPGELPILHAQACPYPELAEQDRGICSMERLLYSELVGEPLKLTQCRLDGDACCSFAAVSGAAH